ncbi:MAG: hypothetical protein LBU61_01955 [Coriobacteriales bacterium]|jgi:hypothetical protein|nr:hypothetical protein [Coriobacteriales bacterium]
MLEQESRNNEAGNAAPLCSAASGDTPNATLKPIPSHLATKAFVPNATLKLRPLMVITLFTLFGINICVSYIVYAIAVLDIYELVFTGFLHSIVFHSFQLVTATLLAGLLVRIAVINDFHRFGIILTTQALWLIAMFGNFLMMLSRLMFGVVSIWTVVTQSNILGLTMALAIVYTTVVSVAIRLVRPDQRIEKALVGLTTFGLSSYLLIIYLARFVRLIGELLMNYVVTFPDMRNMGFESRMRVISDCMPGLLFIALALIGVYLFTQDKSYWKLAVVVLFVDAILVDTIGFLILVLLNGLWVVLVYLAVQFGMLLMLFLLRPKTAEADTTNVDKPGVIYPGQVLYKIVVLLMLQLGLFIPIVALVELPFDSRLLYSLIWISTLLLLFVAGFFAKPAESKGFQAFLRIAVLMALMLAFIFIMIAGATASNGGNASVRSMDIYSINGNLVLKDFFFKSLPIFDWTMIAITVPAGLTLGSLVSNFQGKHSVLYDFIFSLVACGLVISCFFCLMIDNFEVVAYVLLLICAFVFLLVCLFGKRGGFAAYGLLALFVGAISLLSLVTADWIFVGF